MISDVLSDAVVAIREYQRELPEVYEELRNEIEQVVRAMDALRWRLDAVPDASANETRH
jgi:hypothetical protein